MAGDEPKRHHWVPQCYLKNFATSENTEQVWMYQHSKKPVCVGIGNVAAQNNLYTFTDKSTGQKTTEIEKLFSILETVAGPVLEKIVTQRNLDLTISEQGALVEFIAFLAVRGPSFSDWQRNMSAEAYKMHMKAMAEHPEHMRKEFSKAGITFADEKEFEEMREALLNFDDHLKISMKGGEGGLFKQAVEIAGKLTEKFATQKSWHLLVAKGKSVFITSDNPVIIQKVKGIPFHLAEGYEYGTILLTLSPRVCFLMRSFPLKFEVVIVGDKEVEKINQSIMKVSHRQLYSNLESKRTSQCFEKFPLGMDSKISAVRIKHTPFTMTRGPEKDFEIERLESLTKEI